jgi:hypothetical protein
MGHDFYIISPEGKKISLPYDCEIRVGYGYDNYDEEYPVLSIHGHSGKSISIYATNVISKYESETAEKCVWWIEKWKNIKRVADLYLNCYFYSDCIDYRVPDEGYESDGKFPLGGTYKCMLKIKEDIKSRISGIEYTTRWQKSFDVEEVKNLIDDLGKCSSYIIKNRKFCMCEIKSEYTNQCDICGRHYPSDEEDSEEEDADYEEDIPVEESDSDYDGEYLGVDT